MARPPAKHGCIMTAITRVFVGKNPPHVQDGNAMHSDDGAQALGFQSALVPGCFSASYAIAAAQYHFDGDLSRLRLDLQFRRPVYDGVAYRVTATTGDIASDPLAIRVAPDAEPHGPPCIVAAASRTTEAPPPPDRWPPTKPVPQPADRLPASVDACPPGTVLGSIAFTCDPEARGHCGYTKVWRDADHFDYQTRLRTLYDAAGSSAALGAAVHPCYFLEVANGMVCSTIAVGPWIHVASLFETFGAPARLGDRVSVRGRVAKSWRSARGHNFVCADLYVIVQRNDEEEESLAARIQHTAIIRVGKTSSSRSKL